MKRSLTSLAAATTLAVAISAVGAPAAAAPGATVVFVQGLPGKAIELCVNGTEVKSNMQYGGKLKTNFAEGKYKIKVRNKSAGVCSGSLITKVTVPLEEGDNITVVPSKDGSGPLIRVFNNDALFEPAGVPAVSEAALVVSNATKQGPLDAYVAQVIQVSAPTLGKIKQGRQKGIFADKGLFSMWLTKTGKSTPLFGPINKETATTKINHYVAVGTKAQNRKVVYFRTAYPDDL